MEIHRKSTGNNLASSGRTIEARVRADLAQLKYFRILKSSIGNQGDGGATG